MPARVQCCSVGFRSYSLHVSKYSAFTRSTRTTLGAALREIKPVVEAYRRELLKLPDLNALVTSKPSEPLTLAFADKLTDVIIQGYIRGNRATRKPPTRKKPTQSFQRRLESSPSISSIKSIQSMSSTRPPDTDIESWLNDHFSFDWDLPSVSAIRTFTAEAFDYAGKSMSDLLDSLITDARKVLDAGGSFLDWRESLTLQGFEPGNPYHLRTNFDTAANSAFAAGAWKEIQEYADVFPYLRYITMQDDLVREEHKELEGTVLPIDDIFWTIYYPPNGYNCRCSVEQLTAREAEGDPLFGKDVLTPELDPRFMHNSGATNTIWS